MNPYLGMYVPNEFNFIVFIFAWVILLVTPIIFIIAWNKVRTRQVSVKEFAERIKMSIIILVTMFVVLSLIDEMSEQGNPDHQYSRIFQFIIMTIIPMANIGILLPIIDLINKLEQESEIRNDC